MKYNHYEVGPYNLYIINTDKFKRNVITVNFKRKVIKNEITIRNFLSNILIKSTKKHKSERDMIIESEDLYNVAYSGGTNISGMYLILYYEMTFLNEKYASKEINEDAIKFLSEILFNPNIENNAFNEQIFSLVKEEIKNDILNVEEDSSTLATKTLYEKMDKNSPLSYFASGYIDDLNKITPKELYKYYKSVLKSDNIDIFIIGNINPNEIKKLIIDNFDIKTIKKPSQKHFIANNKLRSRVKSVKVKKDLNQSILKIGFKLSNLTEIERKYAITLYNYILGGGPDSKLFRSVREKNSLCYNINTSISKVFNIMTLSAGINAKDYKKTVTLIKKELKNMEKGNFSLEEIEASKNIYKSSFLSLLDSPYNVIGVYEANIYLDLDLIDERIKMIDKITKEMIMNVAKKVKMDTILLLEGEK